jgi:hypothetical protein
MLLLAMSPSVIFTVHQTEALASLAVTASYIAFGILLTLGPRKVLAIAEIWLAVIGAVIAIIAICLYIMAPATARFAIAVGSSGEGRIDPNTTAVGMGFCGAIALTLFLRSKLAWKKGAYLFLFIIQMTAEGLLLSRTAILSSLLALTVAGIFMNTRWRIVIVLFLAIATGSLFFISSSQAIESLANRLSNPFAAEQDAGAGRVQLAITSLEKWTQSPVAFVFGIGPGSLNPHNEYLRFLACGGIVTFFIFLIGVTATARAALRTSYAPPFIYFMVYLLTYGHTKMIWIPMAILFSGAVWELSLTEDTKTTPGKMRELPVND